MEICQQGMLHRMVKIHKKKIPQYTNWNLLQKICLKKTEKENNPNNSYVKKNGTITHMMKYYYENNNRAHYLLYKYAYSPERDYTHAMATSFPKLCNKSFFLCYKKYGQTIYIESPLGT